MSRGEEQKPVTKAYRDNWEAIFAKKDSGLVDSENEKAPTVKTEPCIDCENGRRLFNHNGDRCDERCVTCGGEGVIPIEDSGPDSLYINETGKDY